MRFLVDAMLPPSLAELLKDLGHDVVTPVTLGRHSLPDARLIEIATAGGFVIVTENARDFAGVETCSVLIIRKEWWPAGSLATRLAAAIQRWAELHPEPGPWADWMQSDLR